MIYLQLAGRLGNQLFQWAAALKIQKEYKDVCFIYDDYHQSKPSPMLLELAQEKFEIRKVNSIGRVLQFYDRFKSSDLILKHFINNERNPYGELETVPTKAKIFRGYYQNWRNLVGNEDFISAELNRVTNLIVSNSARLREIDEELKDFCSVHIRRSDYQDSSFGILAPQFYVNSEKFRTKPTLIFTDQEDLPAEYLKAINPEHVFTPKQLSGEETFALMAQGKEVVIANSTFSWWAGFLALNNGSDVQIPDQWRKEGSLDSAFQYPGMVQAKSLFA